MLAHSSAQRKGAPRRFEVVGTLLWGTTDLKIGHYKPGRDCVTSRDGRDIFSSLSWASCTSLQHFHGFLYEFLAAACEERKLRRREERSSRVRRKAASLSVCEPGAPPGSVMLQWMRWGAPAKTGQCSAAESQTVITVSKRWPSNSETDFERCPVMSIPISRMASMARGLTPMGAVPALWTSSVSPPRCRKRPSAIWLRTELPVQRMRTRRLDIGRSPS